MSRVQKRIFRAIANATLALMMCVVFCASARAQARIDTPDSGPLFGAYNEMNRDLEVKVPGGEIRVKRYWDGTKGIWRFNPQHEDLGLVKANILNYTGSDPDYIVRGERRFGKIGPGVWSWATLRGNLGSEPAPRGVVEVARSLGATSCQGGSQEEAIVLNPLGFKWGNFNTHEWGQYSLEGKLLSWGFAGVEVGRVLYDGSGKVRGYADNQGREVVTYIRNSSGSITEVKDYSGRHVLYTYDGTQRLTEVRDLDGLRTAYSYTLSTVQRIATKTEGEPATSIPPLVQQFSYDGIGRVISVKDADNVGMTYSYEYNPRTHFYTKRARDSGGKDVISLHEPEGSTIRREVNGEPHERYFYFCEDYLVVDRNNRQTFIDRDGFGRVQRIVRPDSSWISLQYASVGWSEIALPVAGQSESFGISRIQTSGGREILQERDKNGRVTRSREVLGGGKYREWQLVYDLFGNRLNYRLLVGSSPDDSKDYRGLWTYDLYGNVDTYTNALGRTWSLDHTPSGEITLITEPNGTEWRYTYLPSGKISQVLAPNSFRVTYAYNSRGLLEDASEIYEATAQKHYVYNLRGTIKQYTDPLGNSWKYYYDLADNLKQIEDPQGGVDSYEYDSEYRITKTINGEGDAVSYEYYDTALPGSPAQQLIPFGPVTRTKYSGLTVESREDLLGREALNIVTAGASEEATRYEYDERGRLLKRVAPGGKEATYTYDDLSRMTSETIPGWGTNEIDFDDLTKKVRYLDPEGGIYEETYNTIGQLVQERRATGSINSYVYDSVGNLTQFFNANNQRLEFSYDSQKRLLQKSQYASTTATLPTKSYTYTYNRRGDLLSYADPLTTSTLTVDLLGQPLSLTTNFGSFTKSYAFSYTPNNLRASLSLPEGETVQYLFDKAKRFTLLRIPSEGSINQSYTTDGLSQVSSIQFPGGTRRDYGYDALKRVSQIKVEDSAASPVMDFRYSYDTDGLPDSGGFSSGRITKIDTERGEYNYTYDVGDRLTSQTFPGLASENYSYDQIGRRSTVGETWTYDASGAVLSRPGVTYVYDAQGNRTEENRSGTITKYFYDEADRLVRVESPVGTIVSSYAYDAAGHRILKDVGGTKRYFTYLPEGLSAEYDASGILISKYLYKPNSFYGTEPLALYTGGKWRYFQTDHLGTPRYVTNQAGGVLWSADFEAFGEAHVQIGSVENLLRFPGQYFDGETKLNQNFWRDYDANVGGYLEADPFHRRNVSDRYMYVRGGVTKFVDPKGQFLQVCVVAPQICYAIVILAVHELIDPTPIDESFTPTNEVEHNVTGAIAATALPGFLKTIYGYGKRKFFEREDAPVCADSAGGSTSGLTEGQSRRIQEFSDKYETRVDVVGSRASGTSKPDSDFDYVIGADSRTRAAARRELPRGLSGGEFNSSGMETGIDVFNGNETPTDASKPHIIFEPSKTKW